MTWMSATIGLDLDNTLVCYDDLFRSVALEEGLIDGAFEGGKRVLRDHVRRLPDGEIKWQKFQGRVYGPRMAEAQLAPGVRQFLARCTESGVRAYIVSHKTEYSPYDDTSTNLREAALNWMDGQGFFGPKGMGVCRQDVYFEATRRDKVSRIERLGVSHFVDDLVEVFQETGFPADVERVLYSPGITDPGIERVTVARSWDRIGDILLAGV